jgi:G3E family GTPase
VSPPPTPTPCVPAGLANPGPIISELWTDEELEAAVTLDGVVTLVDGRNIMRQLLEQRSAGAPNEAQLQVALADVILLNKVSDIWLLGVLYCACTA